MFEVGLAEQGLDPLDELPVFGAEAAGLVGRADNRSVQLESSVAEAQGKGSLEQWPGPAGLYGALDHFKNFSV